MKNTFLIIIGLIFIFIFSMQAYMFYEIREKLEGRYSMEPNLSSSQGASTQSQESDQWSPYQELLQIRNQIEQLFNETFSRFHTNAKAGTFTKIPAVDLEDEGNRYVVTVEIPGADESSLAVAINGQVLNISGKTETEKEGENGKYLRQERFKGDFQRSLILPEDVNQASMKTEYKDGVLKIILSKT